ncbi:MAG: hypothetical protein H7320_06115 [Ferruginibacter sp.]|nr:hypothetical protein [Ferruginibacter sp.]
MRATKRLFFLNTAILFILSMMMVTASYSQSKSIARMGSTDSRSFDEGWLFARYGLQTDGSSKDEPANLESETLNDEGWQKLNLTHDWAITGPLRN